MSNDSSGSTPECDEYDLNRQRFTEEQLAPYVGQWVAFSKDGKRIVAAHADLLELDRLVIAAGEDPENVGLESIVRDAFFGAL